MKWHRRVAGLADVAVPAVLAAVLALGVPASAHAQPVLPAPAYDNTLYALVYASSLADPAQLDAQAAELLARVRPGPYAKTGLAEYFALDMPWGAAPGAPLTAPSEELLRQILDGSERHGLVFHTSAMGGISRAVWVYVDAKREDRRNAQWFGDGAIVAPGFSGGAEEQLATAYVTPSRYARKLRRHLEAKVRAFAVRFLELRADYPATLVSASGDAEAELNADGENRALGYHDQPITDYSPFAVLEFRDWLLHTGFYADDGPFAGQGYERRLGDAFAQGAGALSAENLERFDRQFSTPFATWDLKYFHWSLSDPVDGDPAALGAARVGAPGWSPTPAAGADLRAAGFDAPRHRTQYHPRLWDLWLEFRSHMLASHARDFATWMTTTAAPDGATLETDRWYSHQIPADYLNGTRPGSPSPERRLITSASPFWTSIVGDDVGSPGVTVLDRFESGPAGRPVYRRTSQYLFDAIQRLALPNWGMPEYAPSWHIDVAPETSITSIVLQYERAVAAGAHMFAFTPWPHFVAPGANGRALGAFVDRVKYRPRGPQSASYVPPPVRGLSGSVSGKAGALSWSGQVFPETADFAWSQWPAFLRFEVWRGSHPGFSTADGRGVRAVVTPSLSSIPLDPTRPFYKVRAVSRDGRRGALSDAVTLGLASPGPSPTPAPGPSPTPAPGPGPTARPAPSPRPSPGSGGRPILIPLRPRF